MAARSHERDRAALGKTRFALLPQWSDAWGGPISSWEGVEVNAEGRVEKLDLHGKQVKSERCYNTAIICHDAGTSPFGTILVYINFVHLVRYSYTL